MCVWGADGGHSQIIIMWGHFYLQSAALGGQQSSTPFEKGVLDYKNCTFFRIFKNCELKDIGTIFAEFEHYSSIVIEL